MTGAAPFPDSGQVKVVVACDPALVFEQIKELRERVSRAPGYLQWMALQVLETGEHGIELNHVNPGHRSASGACELRVLPQLSRCLRLLLLALREHEEERGREEQPGHDTDGSGVASIVIRCASADLSQVAKP